MPNEKTDNRGFSTANADQERDLAAKGGPSVGLGKADNKHMTSRPLQESVTTQMAVHSSKKSAGKDKKNNGNKRRTDREDTF